MQDRDNTYIHTFIFFGGGITPSSSIIVIFIQVNVLADRSGHAINILAMT